MTSLRHKHIGIFIVILLIATASRLYGLDRLSLWADELWVVIASESGSLLDMLKAVYYHDNHPPGHYLLVRLTQYLLGSSDFAIRFPSALAGIALVAATFVAARERFSVEAALLAAALVAGSYQAIYYSQEARPNIFVALFALLAFHYFCSVVLENNRSLKNYGLFWLSAALCSYFHYAGLVFCVCLGFIFLAALVTKHKKENLLSGIKLFLPVLLLYLPWVLGTLRHLTTTPVTGWQRPPTLSTLKTTFGFLFGPDDIQLLFYLAVFVVTTFIALASVTGYLLNKKYIGLSAERIAVILSAWAMILLPVAIFYIKSKYSQDAYNHRHFLYAIPLMALSGGFYLDALIKRFPEPIQAKLFLVILVFILFYQLAVNIGNALYTANHFKQEFRESAQVLAADKEFNGLIVSNTPFFDHYLKRFTETRRQSDFIFDWDKKITELQALITSGKSDTFYYLEAPILPAANRMVTAEDNALIGIYTPLCRTRFARSQVFKFSVTHNASVPDVENLPDCRVNKK